MADIDLSQSEAYLLIGMPKRRTTDTNVNFPAPGEKLTVALESTDRRETFVLDVTRASLKLTKGKHQLRGRQVIILLRLDIGGAPHRNPDGQEIPCPHLHIYREGFGDKWAEPAPPNLIPNDGTLYSVLSPFLVRCNVVQPPLIQKGLFS